MLKIGINEFYTLNSLFEKGNSYTELSSDDLIQAVKNNWDNRKPGNGEGDRLDRKVLVPIDMSVYENPVFFCSPRIPLKIGMPIKARVVQRQIGEDPYVETYLPSNIAKDWGYVPKSAKNVNVVCYSSSALLENNGNRSTDCDWEIVTILCDDGVFEPMTTLTMARNMLEKVGGTKGDYSALEFAESAYYHSTKGISVRKDS